MNKALAKLGTPLSNISLLVVLEESKLLTDLKFGFITCLSESDNLKVVVSFNNFSYNSS